MRIAYLDCFAGVSGDMFLGALLGAGVPASVLEEAVSRLRLDATLRVHTVDRSGISSIKVDVLEHGELADRPHEHAHDGKHDHEHPHEHAHEEEHTHLHAHEQTHSHSHAHEHAHEHSDEHTHLHAHAHEHHSSPGEKQEHTHEHSHSHKHEHPHQHGRSLSAIRELIQHSSLRAPVKQFAIRTFELLGQSEAKIHNVPVDEIHFHEVGAVDAIVDIVAASAGITYLADAGPLTWSCSRVNVGGGLVECAHGTFPVPAPATADLLRGMPTYSAHVEKELVTPTGAALLRALAPTFGPQPSMRVSSIGYGAGGRNPHGFPNVLRLSLGETETPVSDSTLPLPASALLRHDGATVVVFEAAIDDATPQLLADVAERALTLGALDVMQTAVVMKKGRAATLLTVLANPTDASAIEQLLLRETTTLGIRQHQEQRSCLDRRHESVDTSYGEIRVKIGSLHDEELNAAPEFEDCKLAARAHGVPLKQVQQAAVAAYMQSKLAVSAR